MRPQLPDLGSPDGPLEFVIGSAAALWDDAPAASALIDRLTALPGIGRHKAEVALFLLAREYGVAVGEDRPVDAALSHCARLADFFGP